MALNRIMVWKFDGAPKRLQRLHKNASADPEWIVLVPRDVYRTDIDTAIYATQSDRNINRYQTDDGDFVYIGDVPVQQLHAVIGYKSDSS